MRLAKYSMVLGLAFALGAPCSWAVTNLKKVQVTDGSQVDLLFDGKIAPEQVKTEFFNDIVQVSLTDVSVYPAKISSVSGMELTKVFAYQYAPKLVRCRLSVKGKAEDYQGRIQVKASGKILSIRLAGAVSDKVTHSSSQSTRASQAPEARVAAQPPKAAPAPVKSAPAKEEPKLDESEQALLEKVMKSAPVPPSANAKTGAAGKGQGHLTGNKTPMPSPWRTLGMLGLVLALFGGLAFGIRKIRGGSSLASDPRLGKLLGGLGKLGRLGQKEKMIEVVATYHLAPKKSISVVKIAGRLLVLGVSNESINLITQLDAASQGAQQQLDDLNLEALALESAFGGAESAPSSGKPGYGASAAGTPVFSDVLGKENLRPSGGARARIRSRIEGMKPL